MARKKRDGSKPVSPDGNRETTMPAVLALVEYPTRSRPQQMPEGAYNPYERPAHTVDTVSTRKPSVDLRKLSQWIRTKKKVEALREGESEPSASRANGADKLRKT